MKTKGKYIDLKVWKSVRYSPASSGEGSTVSPATDNGILEVFVRPSVVDVEAGKLGLVVDPRLSEGAILPSSERPL